MCDAYLGETRMEGQCQRGDGIVFRFRRQTCVPQDLYMHSNQPVLCLATWIETATEISSLSGAAAKHRFTLLRHVEEQHAYFWLLRTPATVQTSGSGGSQQFAAYLFKDLVADTSNAVNETRNYIRFDAVRDQPRSVDQVCSDEFEICTDLAGNGQASSIVQSRCSGIGVGSSGIDFRLTCPSTCNMCNATHPMRCSMPASWKGQWQTLVSGTVATTTIGDTVMTSAYSGDVDSADSWHCIQWNASGSHQNEVTLIADYDNGCRQRFRCARVIRQTSALVYLHFSRSAVWPYVRSALDPLDCRAFHFDSPVNTRDGGYAESTAGGSSSQMVALFSDRREDAVACDLPSDLVNFAVTSSSSTNTSCTAGLQSERRTRMRLDIQCSNVDKSPLPVALKVGSTLFSCLDASRGVASNGDRIVIALGPRSGSDGGNVDSNARRTLF